MTSGKSSCCLHLDKKKKDFTVIMVNITSGKSSCHLHLIKKN